MKVKCVDAGEKHGTGKGLLTKDKVYGVISHHGGYYNIICDDGKSYSKLKQSLGMKSLYYLLLDLS